MASIFKDKATGLYRVIIRRAGHDTVSRSGFDTKQEAKEWALAVESKMLYGIELPEKVPLTKAINLFDALTEYESEKTILKKSADRETARISLLKRQNISKKCLKDITSEDISAYIKERENTPTNRGSKTSGATIRLELMLISAVFKHRIKSKNEKLINPIKNVELPKKAKARERVLRDNELAYLVDGLKKAMPETKCIEDLIDIAIQTGMRQNEILKLQLHDLDLKNRYVHLPDTKSGDPRDVPLSPKAIEIFKRIDSRTKDKSERIFNVSQDAIIRKFKKGCLLGRKLFHEKTGTLPSPRFLVDLKFHDLRHQAATIWSKYLHAQELAKMFGWKTLELVMLYYKSDVPTIADKLASA
ncbi:site-specific integrase [Dechloromonas sp. HYN0024]|uniref:tyrosine-type recombinase/integrase n=1 Tax=Dechloromonas sp. HYN0024 TaxID=2231055 RepID=UPI000E43869A|nr:site-specific integrase [Dechloromonas sp. HYN0024]AXS79838.1 site-specific integrase [Dechloromonas sp. HYN0024]